VFADDLNEVHRVLYLLQKLWSNLSLFQTL
jgi:hypothetical protein